MRQGSHGASCAIAETTKGHYSVKAAQQCDPSAESEVVGFLPDTRLRPGTRGRPHDRCGACHHCPRYWHLPSRCAASRRRLRPVHVPAENELLMTALWSARSAEHRVPAAHPEVLRQTACTYRGRPSHIFQPNSKDTRHRMLGRSASPHERCDLSGDLTGCCQAGHQLLAWQQTRHATAILGGVSATLSSSLLVVVAAFVVVASRRCRCRPSSCRAVVVAAVVAGVPLGVRGCWPGRSVACRTLPPPPLSPCLVFHSRLRHGAP